MLHDVSQIGGVAGLHLLGRCKTLSPVGQPGAICDRQDDLHRLAMCQLDGNEYRVSNITNYRLERSMDWRRVNRTRGKTLNGAKRGS